ncbi:alpha-tubulin N-acetyltransferase 1-like [Amphibalanus amphitrite]|uniref:alpha-tubulin N-acetyltransferase 1-like n=1 Tax=Amphibalanus amphitrite TaxID=1232801 RepID=UPI001C911164|nr:alpha-tubulin N-acetyltransferase 1-like [Amphibalanus amphitrite]
MNFQFSLDSIFPEDLMIIGRDLTPKVVDGSLNSSTPSEYYYKHFCRLDPSSKMALGEVLDRMGAASARAQGLSQVITTMEKLRTSENHIVYIITRKHPDRSVDGADICVGFLKVGRKRLFILDSSGGQNEVMPVSVLDFYVHESLQRHGYGRQLFDAMLQTERVEPVHLAIDRPSDKLTSFLAKHCGLRQPCPQTNNFVVYPGFFSDREEDELFYPNKRRSPMKNGYEVTSMVGINGSPSFSRHSHGSSASPCRPASREVRNLHDHHQLW